MNFFKVLLDRIKSTKDNDNQVVKDVPVEMNSQNINRQMYFERIIAKIESEMPDDITSKFSFNLCIQKIKEALKLEGGNQKNVKIFLDTLKKSATLYKDDTIDSIINTKVYKNPSEVVVDRPIAETGIEFVKMYSISTALSMANKEKKVAVLNFADAYKPGGEVLYGISTQEENICRCSNLYYTLLKEECQKEYYEYNNVERNNKIKNNDLSTSDYATDTIIYSPHVRVFKNDENSHHDMLEDTENYVDIITCPAPNIVNYTSPSDEFYINRIIGILNIAAKNGAQILVLGAWGCGAFMNDPSQVSRCFSKAILQHKYFEKIIFAIPDDYLLETFKNNIQCNLKKP